MSNSDSIRSQPIVDACCRWSWDASAASVFSRFALTLLVTCLGGPLIGQAQTVVQAYDVALVRPSLVDDDAGIEIDVQPNTLKIHGVTLEKILCAFFDLQPFLIEAPSWSRKVRWDIDAKMSDYDPQRELSVTAEQRQKRAQAVIAQLFAMQFHREGKMASVLFLREDPKGSKLKVDSRDPEATENRGKVGVWSSGKGRITGWGMAIQDLADQLSNSMEMPVQDRTELAGRYDVRLRWSLPDDDNTSLPPLTAALREQLGLVLVRATGEVQKFVLDAVERPRE